MHYFRAVSVLRRGSWGFAISGIKKSGMGCAGFLYRVFKAFGWLIWTSW